MIVTIWDRQLKNGDGSFYWDFNHVEDGHDETQTHPKAKLPIQATTFSKGVWRKTKADLHDGKLYVEGKQV
jgi:hypothetical protein